MWLWEVVGGWLALLIFVVGGSEKNPYQTKLKPFPRPLPSSAESSHSRCRQHSLTTAWRLYRCSYMLRRMGERRISKLYCFGYCSLGSESRMRFWAEVWKWMGWESWIRLRMWVLLRMFILIKWSWIVCFISSLLMSWFYVSNFESWRK